MKMRTKLIISGFILIICVLTLSGYLWWNRKPNIAIDYAAILNELRKPDSYAEDDDGGPLFMQAAQLLADGEHFPSLHGRRRIIEVDSTQILGYQSVDVRWPADLTVEELAAMKAWLVAQNDVFALAEDGLRKPYSCILTFQIYSKPGPPLFRLAEAVLWRGRIKAWDGDIEGGIADVLAASAMMKSVGQQPLRYEWLQGKRMFAESGISTLQAVAISALSPDYLMELAKEIEAIGRHWDCADGMMDSQRLWFLDDVQRWFSDNGRGDGRILPSLIYGIVQFSVGETLSDLGSMYAFYRQMETRKETVQRYDRLDSMARHLIHISPVELRQLPGDPWSDLEKDAAENFLVARYLYIERPSTSLSRHRATVTGTVAAIQIFRFKAATGEYPESLEDIVSAGYLDEIPTDIYSGQPLIYRRTPEGFTLYSVGDNGQDDGGISHLIETVRLSDPSSADIGKDLVFWPLPAVEGFE